MIYPSFIYLLDMTYIRYYDIDRKFVRSLFIKIKQTRDFFRWERYLIRHVMVTFRIYSVCIYINEILSWNKYISKQLGNCFFLYKVTIWVESSFISLDIRSIVKSSLADIIDYVSNNETEESKSFNVWCDRSIQWVVKFKIVMKN